MIAKRTQEVYYAPTKNKTYVTKQGAIRAEATAIIYKYYPIVPFCRDTGEGFDIQYDRPEYFNKKFKSLCRALLNNLNNN